jgi:microcystin-dependent protein
MFGFNFPPAQWAACNGVTLQIQQFSALFSLIGTAFGGNGTRTFQLPNLAARQLCSTGAGGGLTQRIMGDTFGEAAVALTTDQIPAHNHAIGVYQNGTRSAGPTQASALSTSDSNSIYCNDARGATIAICTTSIGGGNVPHENRQPVLAMNFSIALAGAFPSFD